MRASIDLRPALSAENGKGINLGDAPQLAENKELFVATHRALSEISAFVHEMTVANSARFRRVVTPRSGKSAKTPTEGADAANIIDGHGWFPRLSLMSL
ncbi:hypothetical protein [Methylocystis echinoides]|uniref:hypothetical protein n=1 Tax=Methylocystis echinoides TaxID=29468 RepID=UPI00249352D1|nr:hypothetical protein [Methylocystis echinoides]